MGILDLLTTQGSTLSAHDGATPPINPLTTKNSGLHAKGNGAAGYSLDGALKAEVVKAYNEYEDGVPNTIPQPSTLDLNGKKPKSYTHPEKGTTYP